MLVFTELTGIESVVLTNGQCSKITESSSEKCWQEVKSVTSNPVWFILSAINVSSNTCYILLALN